MPNMALIEMPLPPSQKNNLPYYSSKCKSYSKHPKKNDRKYKSHKYKSHKYKSQNLNKPHKREIKCFKCGKIGHIAPNCRKKKINILYDSDKDYYSSEEITSFFDISQNENSILEKEKDSIDKIENCLCQLNMLTADQELLIEIIDQIEDKEAKAK